MPQSRGNIVIKCLIMTFYKGFTIMLNNYKRIGKLWYAYCVIIRVGSDLSGIGGRRFSWVTLSFTKYRSYCVDQFRQYVLG